MFHVILNTERRTTYLASLVTSMKAPWYNREKIFLNEHVATVRLSFISHTVINFYFITTNNTSISLAPTTTSGSGL